MLLEGGWDGERFGLRRKRAENKRPAEKDKFPLRSDLDHFRRHVERERTEPLLQCFSTIVIL